MRLFTPMFMKPSDIYLIAKSLRIGLCPIRLPVAYHGMLDFVPVKIENLLLKSFDPIFLGSQAPLKHIKAFRDQEFIHAFNAAGMYDEVASNAGLINMSIQHENHFAGFLIPRSLRNGDIVLGPMPFC